MIEAPKDELAGVWVGPHYSSGFEGKRLLILAQAAPLAQKEFRIGRGLESSLTNKYVDGSIKHRAFTDLARMSLGQAAPREQCEKFYREVAFANLPLHRNLKVDDERQNSAVLRDLKHLLHVLKPTTLLLVGAELNALIEPFLPDLIERTGRPTVIRAPHPSLPGFSFRDHWSEVAAILRPTEHLEA